MKRLLSSLALLLLTPSILTLPSCREPERAEAKQAPASLIPELKPRPAGLASDEFPGVERLYASLRERIAKKADDKEAWVALAQLFMGEARVTGDHPYYYPAAERMLDEALKIDPAFIPAMAAKGSVLLSLHRFAEALDVAEQARRTAPNLAVIHGILCDANLELGNYAAAVEAADRMVAIRPDLRSYSRVSYLREIHGDDSGAISAMRLAVDAGPAGQEETEWARVTLGNLLVRNGKLADAEREFLLSLAARPDFPFALAGIARIRAVEGRTDEALRLLDSAATLVPEFSFVQLQSEIHRTRGDGRQADSLVALVETMLGQDEAAGHNVDKEYAILWGEHGIKPDQALTRARAELARRPSNIEAQHATALSLYRAGKLDEAASMIGNAMRLGTDDPSMQILAAMIGVSRGEAGAKAVLERSLGSKRYLSPMTRAEARRLLASLHG